MPTCYLLSACCAATLQVDAGCVPNAQAARDACKQLVSRLHSPDAAAPNGAAARRDDFRALKGAHRRAMQIALACLQHLVSGAGARAWAQGHHRPSGSSAIGPRH